VERRLLIREKRAMRQCGLRVFTGVVVGSSCAAALAQAVDAPLPRGLTPAERAYLAEHPLTPDRSGGAPTGPLWCPPEYAPCEALFMAWEGTTSWNNILAQMGAQITTVGDADLIVGVDSNAVKNSATTTLTSAGVDMGRVRFVVKPLDTIWIRDYGPRFVYENGVRVIVDHTYNRPRPNDNAFNDFFAGAEGIPQYDIPLVHGGGNYHLSGLGDSYATRLIANENPGLTEQEIIDLWQQYQGVLTALQTPFRQNIDSTQHIDMWMIPVADREIIISDWPLASGSYEDNICDSVSAVLAGIGYTVRRVPAVSSGGTHYTFTNAVICNDLVCIPSYTNGTASQYNAQALAVWQAACPGKTVVQIPSQAIVTSAGVLHCIVMHMPAPAGGTDPTVYLRSLNDAGLTLEPGQQVPLDWISDDDVDTYYIKLELSLDGGATWPIIISGFESDDGAYTWTVPDVFTSRGRVKAVVYDYMEGTGGDVNDFDFTINGAGQCVADFNGDGVVSTLDVLAFLNAWGAGDGRADINGDGEIDTLDVLAFLNAWNAGC
jgi:agmatine/peptidylarginine deiminase